MTQIDSSEVERRVAQFMQAARKAGVKLTHQRLEIFREVAASEDHPSAEAVLKALSHRMPTLSHDTVYRTLWLLNDLGLVSTLGPRRESVRFDANLTPHHHFICVRCGLARDFESDELSTLPIPEAVHGFGNIHAARVEVRGVCSACLSQQSSQPPGKES